MICLKLFSFTKLIQALIVWERFMLLRSHRENNIVNFNDAFARIDRIEKNGGTKVYYGDFSNFSVSISEEEALNYRAVILRPVNGWAILFNLTYHLVLRNGNKYSEMNSNFDYGAMTNEGFWRFQSNEGRRNFILVGLTSLAKSGNIKWQDIHVVSRGKWEFIQEFEWKDDLFACFGRSDIELIVLRLKRAPENFTQYGTFISSFYLESTYNPKAYFLPSYPDPIMYYSKRIGGDGTLFFDALELKDAIEMSDQGFRQCEEKGTFPSNFFKLRPYIYNVIKETNFKPGECKTEIPCFELTKSIQCFQLSKLSLDFNTIDIYTVGLDFKAKILSFIDGSSDVRCDLSDCGKVMVSCKSEKIQFRYRHIFSTFWNFDNFTFTRWDKNGPLGQFRLLDCEYFQSCSLCILYGSFNCRWNSSNCIKKSNSSIEGENYCYSEISARTKSVGFTGDETEISVEIPHQLDPSAKEFAWITIDGIDYHDIKYENYIYETRVNNLRAYRGILTIIRGPYKMIVTFKIDLFGPPSLPTIVVIIYSLIIILAIITIFMLVVYGIKSGKTKERESHTVSSLASFVSFGKQSIPSGSSIKGIKGLHSQSTKEGSSIKMAPKTSTSE